MLADVVCKAKLLHDFGFFVRYFFKSMHGKRFLVAEHHAQIIDALTRVARGDCRRLIINIPPRFGKTEVAVKMFIAWCLANNPRARFIHLSYSDDLALDNSSQVRELVKSDEFQRFFPTKLKTDSDSKKKWYTVDGGGLYATAAGGAITGFGAGDIGRVYAGTGSPADGMDGCILIDDPNKPDDAFSDVMRDRVNRRYNNTIASRVNSPETPIVLIQQRLHESDMTGFLLAGGSGEKWEHLCIPAINEHGDSIWPEIMPIERLRTMEESDPYTFAGQYMQRPSPLAGGIIKPDNIALIDALPTGIPIEWVRGWDFASTEKGDYTAGAKLGKLPDGRVIIADIVRIRAAPDERDAALLHTCARDGTQCRVSIPQDPGQAGVTQVKYLVRNLAGYSVRATPETGNKVVRAEPLAAQINVGNAMMLRGEWNAAFVNECRMFPNGTHDDQVDACSRAYAMLIGTNQTTVFWTGNPYELTGKQKALHESLPGLPERVVHSIADDTATDTCGKCHAYSYGACKERGFTVGISDAACEIFMPSNVEVTGYATEDG